MSVDETIQDFTLGGVHNVRDLGGKATASGGMTVKRRFLRGDALRGLDTDGLRDLIDGGLATIVDMRSHHEVSEAPNPLAGHDRVAYHHIPLYDGLATIDAMAEAHPDGFDMGLRYRAAFDSCQPAMAQVLRTMASAGDGTILFHCTAGKDRTGVIAALLLLHAGVSAEDTVADYALTATYGSGLIAQLRERALARGTDPDRAERVLGSAPATMRGTLAWLDQTYGGATPYLHRIGLTDVEQAALRDRLTA